MLESLAGTIVEGQLEKPHTAVRWNTRAVRSRLWDFQRINLGLSESIIIILSREREHYRDQGFPHRRTIVVNLTHAGVWR